MLLANYASKYEGLDTEGDPAGYGSMSDASDVSEYARKAIGWCYKNKILSGSDGRILPKDTASRAQTAKMMVFMHDLLAD